jgi:hypothetical protein
VKGASKAGDVRLGFDRRARLELNGLKICSDGGLPLCRELDEVLGPHELAGSMLRDICTCRNRRYSLRQHLTLPTGPAN